MVGAGFVWYPPSLPPESFSIPLGTEQEVYDAELQGILGAARRIEQYLHTVTPKKRMVYIFVDNQAAIKRLKHLYRGPGQEVTIELAEICRTMSEMKAKLIVEWVPGHKDVDGNEKADAAAKEATLRKIPRFQTTTMAYLKRKIREKMVEEWKLWFERYPVRGTNYKAPFQLKPSLHVETTSKIVSSAIMSLRTGHGYFRPYLKRIQPDKHSTGYCQCNYRQKILQEPRHLIMTCPIYKNKRRKMQRIAGGEGGRAPYEHWLYDHKLGIPGLIWFIRNTGIGTRKWLLGELSYEDEQSKDIDFTEPGPVVEERPYGWGDIEVS